jgi:arylformamidase
MGDKTSAGSPFYDNIGQWAAQQGFIGVTLTYRLAPAHHWPCGPEDMAQAVRWLRANIGAHGGDPAKIFLLGQSAGAVHVAAYTAHAQFHDEGDPGIAGALMTSGIYDPTTQPPNPFGLAYYGESPATLAQARCTAGLLASRVPLLFSVSELDPADFQAQAAQLAAAWFAAKGAYPPDGIPGRPQPSVASAVHRLQRGRPGPAHRALHGPGPGPRTGQRGLRSSRSVRLASR